MEKTTMRLGTPHYCDKVRAFHVAFGCAAPSAPVPMDDQTRFARVQLCGEEVSELVWGLAAHDMISCFDALGDIEYVVAGTIVATGYDTVFDPPHMTSAADGPPRMPHPDMILQVVSTMFDGVSALCMTLAANDMERTAQVAGSMLVSLGSVWSLFGVPEAVRQLMLTEIHDSNMTKFGEDGRPVVNEAGRVVKGPNFRPPDLLRVLREVYGEGWNPPPLRQSPSTPLSGAVR